MAKKTARASSGSSVSTDIRNQLSKALGSANILSLVYKGRDTSGNPMYTVRYSLNRTGNIWGRTGNRSGVSPGPSVTKTITFSNGKIGVPTTKPSGVPPASGNKPNAEMELEREKDKALKWLAQNYPKNMPRGDYDSFRSQILNWKRDAKSLNTWVNKVLIPNIPFGHVAEDQNAVDPGGYWDGFDWGGGGGGGGFSGPEYRAPDRRVVEDMVKGSMISLVGSVLQDRLDAAVNLYMKDHRRNFDSVNAEIDPAASILEYIRQQPEYEQIHHLRPEGQDERQWISDRRYAAARGGLQVDLQDEFAVTQATVGGDLADVEEAGAVAQTVASGSTRGTTLEGKLRETATNMFRGLVL